MLENLFIGSNVIQSNWDTESFVMTRHQLRARLKESTLQVQVIEQSLIERIGTWLSHFIGQNNTYAHQLKLVNVKVKFQANASLSIYIQKILNSYCKLDGAQNFNIQNVLKDLTDTLYSEALSRENDFLDSSIKMQPNDSNDGHNTGDQNTVIGLISSNDSAEANVSDTASDDKGIAKAEEPSKTNEALETTEPLGEIKSLVQGVTNEDPIINSKSTVDNTERIAENKQSLLDEMINGWQRTVDWLINGLEQAKDFNKKEREGIEGYQRLLEDSWLDISKQAAELE